MMVLRCGGSSRVLYAVISFKSLARSGNAGEHQKLHTPFVDVLFPSSARTNNTQTRD